MRESSLESREHRLSHALPLVAFLVAVAVRTTLVLTFPTIHGGDAAARLANPTQLVLGYQLPLPQAFVVLGKALSDDPLLARLIFGVWGGVLASGMTALAEALGGTRRAAGLACVLFSFDPLLIHYSIVPYQESVAYGLLAWAFVLGMRGRTGVGACLMAAACLCRYEAWLFVPIFYAVTRSRSAGFALVPIAIWVAWWRGLGPSGLYVLDIDLQARRLSRVQYLAGKLVEYETLIPAACALLFFGALAYTRDRRVTGFVAAVGAVTAVIVAFGHEFPPGSGQMSERLIHLPVLVCLLLLATGLARLSDGSSGRMILAVACVMLLAGRNIRFEAQLLQAAARDPDLALARDIARSVESERRQGECVTVNAPLIDPRLIDAYVAKVDAGFGDAEKARRLGIGLSRSAPDRDRIAAHLAAPPGTVRADPGCALRVDVDGAKSDGQGRLLQEITAGERRAWVTRIRE